jgi:hypothetical protein
MQKCTVRKNLFMCIGLDVCIKTRYLMDFVFKKGRLKKPTSMKYKHLKTYEKMLLKQLPVVILGYVLI